MNRQLTRTPSDSHPDSSNECWYHWRYGDDARKCKEPYSYKRKQKAGKRRSQRLATTSPPGNDTNSRLFYVTDKQSGRRFLIDTGAEISVLPPTASDRKHPSNQYNLQAITKSPIATFGERSVTLDIGLRRTYQIPVEPTDVPKTAVTTPFGLFEFTRMPFGLRNAAETFQRFIDQVVRGLDFVYAYIDDLLIASTSVDEHHSHLQQLFARLQEYGVVINPAKSLFGASSLEFLGHHVLEHGIHPLSTKIKAIQEFPQPQSLRRLRQFLGLINFYRRFIPHCARLVQPLTDLLAGKPKNAKALLELPPESS